MRSVRWERRRPRRFFDHSDLGGFAESYALIHEEFHDPRYREARVHLQDLLADRAAALARREKFDASEVRTLFKNGSPMIRALTLGLMREEPPLADSATIISAIADSRSGNEQHNDLQLALLCWPNLLKSERHAIQRQSPTILAFIRAATEHHSRRTLSPVLPT